MIPITIITHQKSVTIVLKREDENSLLSIIMTVLSFGMMSYVMRLKL